MLSTLVATTLLVAGCDKPSESEQAIERASRKLAQLDTGAGATPAPEFVLATYEQVRTELAPARSGAPVQKAAADVLLAETHLGEGSIRLRRAAEADREAALAERRIDILLDSWAGARADLEVARAFDATERLDRIESERARIRNEQADLRSRIQELQSRIERLEQEQADLIARAEQQRDIAAQAALSRDPAPSPESLEVLRKAELHRRAADTLRLKADKLGIRIGALEPEIDRLRQRIAQLENGQEALVNARQRIAQDAQDAAEQAEDAARRAREIVARIEAHLLGPTPVDVEGEPLAAYRQANLGPTFEQAADSYEQAAQLARGARQHLRAGAQAAEQRAASRLWSANLLRWHSLERYLRLLERARGVPALPEEQIVAEIRRVRRAEADTLVALSESVGDGVDQSVAAGFSNAAERVSEAAQADDQEALQPALDAARGALEAVIDARGSAAQDALENREVAAASASASGSSGSGNARAGSQSGSSGDLSTPEAVVDRFIQLSANGRLSEAASIIRFENGAQREAFQAIAAMSEAFAALDSATLDRFGQRVSDAIPNQAGMTFDELTQLRATDLDIRSDGDTASVSIPGGQNPLQLRRDGQRWWIGGASIVGPEIANAPPQATQGMVSAFGSITRTIGQLESRVRSGEFSNVQAIQAELEQAMQQVMQQMMQQMMGGGG